MKIVSLIILITMILSFQTAQTYSANAFKEFELKQTSNDIMSMEYTFDAVDDENYHIEENGYTIYGNYVDFDSDLLYSLIHDDSKICIFYDLDLTDNINDNHEILRNNAVVYYHKDGIPFVNSYTTNATDTESIICDINNYVNEVLSKIEGEIELLPIQTQYLTYGIATTGNETFEVLYSGSFRKEHKPHGYVDCDYVVRKYRANDISSLYLVESQISFTPGKTAYELGNTDYGSGWLNKSGYIKIKAERAEHEVGYDQIRYGGTPVYKDAYPVNTPGVVSISSSYNSGANLGYSNTNGFSLYDISIESGNNGSASIEYAYSKTYQNTEPALSAQKDPSDVDKYTWLYTYSDPRNETNNLNLGYLFEMNNSGHDLFEGDLALRFEYKMIVEVNFWDITIATEEFTGYVNHNYYR